MSQWWECKRCDPPWEVFCEYGEVLDIPPQHLEHTNDTFLTPMDPLVRLINGYPG